jgi:hypothetical protein
MHMQKTSPWCRVVSEALLYRGFRRWTGVPKLFIAFRNADGLVAEVRGGHRVRFIWKSGASCEYVLKTPTDIDRVIDEVLGKKS